MINKEIRDKIDYFNDNELGETEDGIKILDNPSFDNSIIGITSNYNLIYDYEKMIEEFMQDEECSYEEAVEFIEYNTMRALPYIQTYDYAPIVLYTKLEDIENE